MYSLRTNSRPVYFLGGIISWNMFFLPAWRCGPECWATLSWVNSRVEPRFPRKSPSLNPTDKAEQGLTTSLVVCHNLQPKDIELSIVEESKPSTKILLAQTVIRTFNFTLGVFCHKFSWTFIRPTDLLVFFFFFKHFSGFMGCWITFFQFLFF